MKPFRLVTSALCLLAVVGCISPVLTTSVATPTFSYAAGTYAGIEGLAVTSSTTGATIYYTLDGTTPTTGSLVYSTPLSLAAKFSTTTLRAIAVKTGYENSAEIRATYVLTPVPDTLSIKVVTGKDYCSLASSSGGELFIAARQSLTDGNGVYISKDKGMTWVAAQGLGNGTSWYVAVSSDGQNALAALKGGYLWVSQDAGSTWTKCEDAGSRDWSSVSVSATGATMLASVNNGDIWASSNTGSTWATTASGSKSWSSLTLSANGATAGAVAYEVGPSEVTSEGDVVVHATSTAWISTDSGQNWTKKAPTDSPTNIANLALSADASLLVATDNGGGGSGQIWTSSDLGTSWTASSFSDWWNGGLCLSSDGRVIIATGMLNGNMGRISCDGGVNFTSTSWSYPEGLAGAGLACTGDGSLILLSLQDGSVATIYSPTGVVSAEAVAVGGASAGF